MSNEWKLLQLFARGRLTASQRLSHVLRRTIVYFDDFITIDTFYMHFILQKQKQRKKKYLVDSINACKYSIWTR